MKLTQKEKDRIDILVALKAKLDSKLSKVSNELKLLIYKIEKK